MVRLLLVDGGFHLLRTAAFDEGNDQGEASTLDFDGPHRAGVADGR